MIASDIPKVAYIVTAGAYSDYHIVGVFDDKSAAERFLDRLKKRFENNYFMQYPQIETHPIYNDSYNFLEMWPDNEVIEVWYEVQKGSIWIAEVKDLCDVNVTPPSNSEESGRWLDGGEWFRFLIPASSVPDAKQMDRDETLKQSPLLLKIAQDRYAAYKARESGIT